MPSTTVHIILRKVRNKTTGTKTDQPVVLSYDRRTGRYDELRREDSDIDVDGKDVEPSSTPNVGVAVYQMPSDVSTSSSGSGGINTSHAVGASVTDAGADETQMPDTYGQSKAGTGGASSVIDKPEAGDTGSSASPKFGTVVADAVIAEPDTAVAGAADVDNAESDTAPEAIKAYEVSEAPEASETSEGKEEEGHPQQEQPLSRRPRRGQSTSASDTLSDNSQGGTPAPADKGVDVRPHAAVGGGAGDTKRSNTPRIRGASIAIGKPVAEVASDKGKKEKRGRGRPRKSPK